MTFDDLIERLRNDDNIDGAFEEFENEHFVGFRIGEEKSNKAVVDCLYYDCFYYCELSADYKNHLDSLEQEVKNLTEWDEWHKQ
jgi:hypothetical protein